VAEPGAVEEHVEGVDEALVAAPVDLQRGLGTGPAGGIEVGVDVGPPERVDRLFGVADKHERGPGICGGGRRPAECPAHDFPLDRVGVLELVHQRHPVAGSQTPARDLAPLGIGEGVTQPGEQVVVGQHCGQAPAAVDLCPHGAGQTDTQLLRAVVGGAVGLEEGIGVRCGDLPHP